VEIHGIPDTVQDGDLEDKVIQIAKSIDVEVDSKDIEACHRLPNRRNSKGTSKRTIVRFVNRKHCGNLQMKKSSLKNAKDKLKRIGITNNLYINSNLCPYNSFPWGKCKKLYTEQLISRFWSYNGSIFILEEDGQRKIIEHLTNLKEIFPGFDF